MKRTGTFGVLALCALALSVLVVPSAASAAKFVSEASPFVFASSSGSQSISFGAGGAIECPSPSVEGAAVGNATTTGSAVGELKSQYTAVSGKCVSAASIDWKSCKLTFYPDAEGGTQGSVEIGPSGCGPILVKGLVGCERTIPAQAGIPATYKNQGAGTGRTVAVTISTTALQWATTVGGCGGIGSHNDGVWQAGLTLAATNASETAPIGIHVAELPVGVYLAGEKSEDPAKQPRFEAEENPTALVGGVSKTHNFLLKAGGSTVSCENGDLSSALAGSSTQLSIEADYTKCANFIGSQVSVDMHSCSYGFAVSAGPPYTGSAAVGCSSPGDAIELIVGNPESPICTYEMPVQLLTGVTYETTGSLNERKVVAEVNDTSVNYVRTYNGFFCPGASNNGAFSGGFTLEGVE